MDDPRLILGSWDSFRKHMKNSVIPDDPRLKAIYLAGYIAGARFVLAGAQQTFDAIGANYTQIVNGLDLSKDEPIAY